MMQVEFVLARREFLQQAIQRDRHQVAGFTDLMHQFCRFLHDRGLADDDFLRRDDEMMALYNNQQLSMPEYIESLLESE